MIWFKISLEKSTLDNSVELTTAVKEMLGTTEVHYTGAHEIIENDLTVEDEFWDAYKDWENSLLVATQTEERGGYLLTRAIQPGVVPQGLIKIKGSDLPAWYVRETYE